ncbi:MAG: DUF302 domain-containing protein [Thermoplasmatales archaeon]
MKRSNIKDLLVAKSRYTFEETVDLIVDRLEAAGFTIFCTIDHSDAAEKVGLKLKPTTVIVFGNPLNGTSLMERSETIGIDLPSKILVTEREGTTIAFNPILPVKRRHGFNVGEDATESFDSKVEKILDELAVHP